MKNVLKTKICSKCNKQRPLNDFNKLIRGKGGRRAQCKTCDHQYRKQRGLQIPQTTTKYELNKQTMMNHMYIHFGWWESRMTTIERDQSKRDVKKYYKEELPIEFKEK